MRLKVNGDGVQEPYYYGMKPAQIEELHQKRNKEIQEIQELTQDREPQRLQNCKKLESELLFLYLQSLPYLDDSSENKVKVDLHKAYIDLIQLRDRCQWADIKVPKYVNKCIDILVKKAFSDRNEIKLP